MNRRAFLSLSAVSPLAHLLPAFAARPPKARELKADVAVIGGSVGGVACALAAARNGLSVILTEEYDWIGGQLTSQAVPPDEHPWIETQGSTKTYRSYRDAVRDFYRRNYPLTAAAHANAKLNPGNGSVSKLCHEPRVSLAVLLEMLSPHIAARRIHIVQGYRPAHVELDGDRFRAVELHSCNPVDRKSVVVVAETFVDGTETGELLALGKVEHVTGPNRGVTPANRTPHRRKHPRTIRRSPIAWASTTLPAKTILSRSPTGTPRGNATNRP